MTRKSRGTYVTVFGLILAVGGIPLSFLPGPGWMLIPIGLAVVAIGVVVLLFERNAAKIRAMSPPAEPPDPLA